MLDEFAGGIRGRAGSLKGLVEWGALVLSHD
jgi:hypothetical protein